MPKPLLAKLGYQPGTPARTWAAPIESSDAFSELTLGDPPLFLIAFTADQAALTACAAEVIRTYQRGGWLWFAYPKKSGRLKSDLNRDAGWAPVEAAGLLPVTQVALDDTWSALRFRFRDEIKKLTRRKAD